MIDTIGKRIQEIDTNDLRTYLTEYQNQKNSSRVTIDNIRRILSSFFSWLEDEEYILKSPVCRIHKVKAASTVKETYSDEALETMWDNCKNLRDLALIDMLASTGIRVSELVLLNREDINFVERECIVFGKGDKERIVYFDARTKIHLQLEGRIDKNCALFVSLKAPYERLKIGGIEARLRELGKRLDIQKVHPHKFRRTLATQAIDKGMPVEQLQKLLGHQRINTTMQYAMIKQSNVKLAHKKYIGWDDRKVLRVRLADICSKIGSGATPKGGKGVYSESGISLIRSQNVLDFSFSDNGLVFIDEVQAAKLSNVEISKDDVLLNITGDSVARCCIVDLAYIPARVNQHVAIIRPKTELALGISGKDVLLVNTLMYVYLSFVLYFTLMPVITSIPFVLNHPYKSMNLVPFIDVSMGRGDFLRQVILNVIMTMPFGFLFPLLQKRTAKFGRTVFFCFLMSAGIELLQPLINGFRSSDITDIITNMIGGMFGYRFYVIFKPITFGILEHLKSK